MVASSRKLAILTQDNISLAFSFFDQDGDNRITSNDLSKYANIEHADFSGTELYKSYYDVMERAKEEKKRLVVEKEIREKNEKE